jgi:hypothetical protein
VPASLSKSFEHPGLVKPEEAAAVMAREALKLPGTTRGRLRQPRSLTTRYQELSLYGSSIITVLKVRGLTVTIDASISAW